MHHTSVSFMRRPLFLGGQWRGFKALNKGAGQSRSDVVEYVAPTLTSVVSPGPLQLKECCQHLLASMAAVYFHFSSAWSCSSSGSFVLSA